MGRYVQLVCVVLCYVMCDGLRIVVVVDIMNEYIHCCTDQKNECYFLYE